MTFSTLIQEMFQGKGLILGLVFMMAFLLTFAIVIFLRRKQSTADRLDHLTSSEKKVKKTAKATLVEPEQKGLVSRVTAPTHKLILPTSEATKKKIRRELLQAGFRSRQAFRNYLSLKVLLACLLPLAFNLRTLFIGFSTELVAISLFLALVGFFMPNWFLRFLISQRQREITRALPDALDLMVICVEAGLGLDMTFRRVGNEVRSISPNLSDEFLLVNQEVRAGRPRDEAYQNLSLRTGVKELHNLLTILSQTSRFGTSIAQALRVHADAMRVKRRQIAEETAAKAVVKLVFPLVVFIFPAMFVVILGPAAIRIYRVLLPTLAG